jgi:hypothetical protein
MDTRFVHGQPSWVAASDRIELAVTAVGAHMAPVVFDRHTGRPFQPYYISPWQGEGRPMPAPILAPLRGDFFCLPFGGNGTPFHGERHPPHGETSGSPWRLTCFARDGGKIMLELELETTVRPGRVVQRIELVDGHDAIYTTTRIEGFAGPAPFGHHAILAVPEQEGALRIATSPFQLGMTCPHVFSDPANREYQSLAVGAEFDALGRVPTAFRAPEFTDCSVFPARRGYADLIGLHEAAAPGRSWVAVVNAAEAWLWFALKDPAVMPARLFWTDNRGRHGSPWNGRNVALGVEDGCLYYDKGVAEAAAGNIINRRGIPTAREFRADAPSEIRYIQGAVRIPAGFDRVTDAQVEADRIVFRSPAGLSVPCRVQPGYLDTGAL